MQKSTGGASPYPKSVIGNDEGGFARTWRTKTYSGRERGGGSKTSCNPKPTDHFPGTVQNLPTRSRKAVTEVRAAQNEGGS